MRYNEAFNLSYLAWLSQHAATREEAREIARIIPSSRTYILLGQAYRRLGLRDSAKYAFQQAARMVPARVTPRYYLWEMYAREGDHRSARAMAHEILATRVKVETTFTLRAKANVKRYLDETRE
ncbi:MAG: hypothetical protein LBP56_00410 [Odoribacteraceae bacterium]|jgi:Flp pilus assembly protein TadD|nr:hypothetical protein [Odoribacteraceae bacterium]